MFNLILWFLYMVSAQYELPMVSAQDEFHKYSRVYLRGLKRLEDKRITALYINKGFTYIENAVISAAKQGLLKYKTEPFEGYENAPFDKSVCENIINGIHRLVSERFPDSEIIYNSNTKRYIIKWD